MEAIPCEYVEEGNHDKFLRKICEEKDGQGSLVTVRPLISEDVCQMHK